MRRIVAIMTIAVLALLGAGAAGRTQTPSAHAGGQSGTSLTATVSATASLTLTYHWTIDKSVTPATWNLFRGDSGTSAYTVAVTKDSGTLAAALDGQVCIENTGTVVATENLAIAVNVSMPPSSTVIASAPVDVSAHPVLQPQETYCYAYHVDIASPVAGGNYKVTANVTITNHSGSLGTPHGPSPSATAAMPASPTVINGTINVDDTNGQSWQFSDSGSQTYNQTFTCDADQGAHSNTATIRETGQSSTAGVTVNCYALGVTKTANTSFSRQYQWSIQKAADQSALTLALNQSFPVNYTVSVDVTGHTDSNFAAAGTISVKNPAPIAAMLNGVSDLVSGGIAGTVNCGVTFPYTLASNGTLMCNYTAALPDPTSRTNTGTATLQNYSYGSDGTAAAGSMTFFTGQAAVDFSTATVTEVDKCITVTDSLQGTLGTVCLGTDTLPKVFSYGLTVGPYSACGPRTVNNTAGFTTSDTQTTGSATWTVNVGVPCNTGCTLSIGYWKTHAGFTGNNPDQVTPLLPIWLGTVGGAKSFQVTTATQAVQTLSFNGVASNGINKLYAQLLAAKFSIASGASGSAVASTITAADAFLATHNAGDWGSLTKAQQAQVLSWATTLDSFNNGLIGPGHCSQ